MKADNWHHIEDPHKVVPNGFSTNTYTVIGFCSPAGKEIKRLMVNIRYSNGAETTRDYLNVLKDFLNS